MRKTCNVRAVGKDQHPNTYEGRACSGTPYTRTRRRALHLLWGGTLSEVHGNDRSRVFFCLPLTGTLGASTPPPPVEKPSTRESLVRGFHTTSCPPVSSARYAACGAPLDHTSVASPARFSLNARYVASNIGEDFLHFKQRLFERGWSEEERSGKRQPAGLFGINISTTDTATANLVHANPHPSAVLRVL